MPSRDKDHSEAAEIAAGNHSDVFGYLGPHTVDRQTVVRAFLPDARQVQLVDPETHAVLGELANIHHAGLFEGTLARDPSFHYRLMVDFGSGALEMEDPYRFPPWLGDMDVYYLAEGSDLATYNKLGAHVATLDGSQGVVFAVWAPNAARVSVVGDFNNWDGRRHPMRARHGCGVWEIFLPGLKSGERYKYEIRTRDGSLLLKADPYAFFAEAPPLTASIVWQSRAQGAEDADWIQARSTVNDRHRPISIYEVHLGSWRRRPEDGNRYLTYRELADELIPYVKDMGFTHIELLPVAEYPFDGSWGYQPTGLFAPTSRFGSPDDFRAFVERCHRAGLGVLMDWVPGHFPTDPHGLGRFDGTELYEHADPRMGRHKDWDTLIYNYGRNEVGNFLLSNALFWLNRYHVDGLRVDAVASMLYLDYSRKAGEWVPNIHGGNENLEAIAFLRRMNETLYGHFPGGITVAEESTAWPMVSRPVYLGGLGFGYKWNMGWMHDTLSYMQHDPIHRRYHHHQLRFGLVYAFSENFVLPLSHDEVVHGKGSLLGKMPGDEWQKFANLRTYFTFMFTHPGKKLLFMGGEFAQTREWNHDTSLDWHELDKPLHAAMQRLVRDLNRLYRELPSLHQLDCEAQGFEWIDANDDADSVISYLRKGHDAGDVAVIVCNFTPVPRRHYRVGVPTGGSYREMLNSDAECYGGSNIGNDGAVTAQEIPCHGRPFSLDLSLPPLAGLVLVPERT